MLRTPVEYETSILLDEDEDEDEDEDDAAASMSSSLSCTTSKADWMRERVESAAAWKEAGRGNEEEEEPPEVELLLLLRGGGLLPIIIGEEDDEEEEETNERRRRSTGGGAEVWRRGRGRRWRNNWLLTKGGGETNACWREWRGERRRDKRDREQRALMWAIYASGGCKRRTSLRLWCLVVGRWGRWGKGRTRRQGRGRVG